MASHTEERYLEELLAISGACTELTVEEHRCEEAMFRAELTHRWRGLVAISGALLAVGAEPFFHGGPLQKYQVVCLLSFGLVSASLALLYDQFSDEDENSEDACG